MAIRNKIVVTSDPTKKWLGLDLAKLIIFIKKNGKKKSLKITIFTYFDFIKNSPRCEIFPQNFIKKIKNKNSAT
jgi:hypothetical protein